MPAALAHQGGQPADQGDRPTGQLGLDQVPRARQLVGERHRGSPAGRCRTGRADPRSPRRRGRRRRRWPRRSGPVRHARPSVSDTTTPTSTPARSRMPARKRAALASGSMGSRSTSPGSTLKLSTPAAARTSPLRSRTIRVGPRREGVRRGRPDRGLPRGGRHGAALALADDLGRHDEDVAVAQRPGRVVPDRGEDQGHQVVPGRHLADSAEPHHLHRGAAGGALRHPRTASTVVRTNRAVAAGLLMTRSSVSAASRRPRARRPTPRPRAHDPRVQHAVAGAGPVVAADGGRVHGDADRGQQAVGHPARGRRAGSERSRSPGRVRPAAPYGGRARRGWGRWRRRGCWGRRARGRPPRGPPRRRAPGVPPRCPAG